MRLYTLDHSPYSTRVRTQIRHKHLPIKFVRPPELRSKILKNTFPLGQLPVLELDDGELLGESTVILNYLHQQEDGFAAVHDKSDPALITRLFGISKKAFKQAIGGLYKQHLIVIEKTGIRLVEAAPTEEQ